MTNYSIFFRISELGSNTKIVNFIKNQRKKMCDEINYWWLTLKKSLMLNTTHVLDMLLVHTNKIITSIKMSILKYLDERIMVKIKQPHIEILSVFSYSLCTQGDSHT